MQCFDNYIGIYRGVGTASTSGGYITDLAGLNFNRFEAIMEEDTDVDVETFIQRKIDFALSLVLDDLSVYLIPNFRINTLLDGYKQGSFTGDYLAVSATERGQEIRITKTRFSRILISAIKVRARATDDVLERTLKIIDGYVETEYEFTLPVGGGIVNIPIDYKAENDTVQIVMDNTTLEVDNGKLNTSCTTCSSSAVNSNYYSLYGYNGTGTDSKSYGIAAEFTIICDAEEVLCALKPQLKFIGLFKCGIELLKEQLSSSNLNYFTIHREEDAQKTMETWQSEYDIRWKILVKNLSGYLSNMDDVCLKCTSNRYIG
jgi:hypothetical protein